MSESINTLFSVITYSQACTPWPLPSLLSHQPLLYPRLQRSAHCLLQRCFPQQEPSSPCCCCCCSCCYLCSFLSYICFSYFSLNTREWAQATWVQLQSEQHCQTPRLPKQWCTWQQCSKQYVSKTAVLAILVTFCGSYHISPSWL